ncbi:MAG: ATP-binding protein [Candidatus Sphingomonas colombiensis]|nr:ATP-binding protein [Sphingomonas sp.]WEK41768.1 MAG: ATP-binding protein [Sphingomonas sp.]
MSDLFAAPSSSSPTTNYDASSIEVLEGLEPVRRRPGMYVGGTDERALHHLAAEVLDNAMDEAVAGHATRIEVDAGRRQSADRSSTTGAACRSIRTRNSRTRAALEVILSTLHSGGKFAGKAYATSGGLHGVGVSRGQRAVVRHGWVEVARGQTFYRQSFSRGLPLGPLERSAPSPNRRGTSVRFRPDAQIFGTELHFKPARLFRLARSKAYLFARRRDPLEMRARSDPRTIRRRSGVPVPRAAGGHLREQVAGTRMRDGGSSSRARRNFPASRAASNGRWPGRYGRDGCY